METEEILDFISKLGVLRRHPHSDFYKTGNEKCGVLKSFGICDHDNEALYHKLYPMFSCHIPKCNRTFETVIEYEAHYNSCHSFTCKECKKNLPNYHLLDLHISETHDSFFLEQAKRKPMFKCFSEECKECFKDPQERKDHCIKVHKYPSDFRFDSTRKKKGVKKNKKEGGSKHSNVNTAANFNETAEKMDVSDSNVKKASSKTNPLFKGFKFGHSQSKTVPVFHNFSKDLMDTLPES